MKYYRVTLPTPADEWATDILMQKLGDIGFNSFENDDKELHAYIPVSSYNEASIEATLSEAPFEALQKQAKLEEVEDKNWNEEWEKHYFDPVVVVEGELGIRAPFHQPIEGVKHEIVIEPKMAFGTGNHATTQAMLTLLSQIYLEGCSVIDMGCGSGILGIYAMMRGAKECVSIDIDDWCIENAEENARQNNVALKVLQGDANILQKIPRADIFLANINRNIILQDLERYVSRMHPSGIMLLSGFLDEDLPQIMDAVSAHGLTHSGHIEMPGGWVAMRVTNQMP